ncbi:hypothetical protein CEXT_187871 [Caerostris extrusa]|uniref:Uncharacterized protein n=1 Tax=Caerostris extrusa TaxID=172846 RepID=A0AAV4MM11_CAEEX|nr:hypothetical protein CEXT_187871 [Caerostris extrusa]
MKLQESATSMDITEQAETGSATILSDYNETLEAPSHFSKSKKESLIHSPLDDRNVMNVDVNTNVQTNSAPEQENIIKNLIDDENENKLSEIKHDSDLSKKKKKRKKTVCFENSVEGNLAVNIINKQQNYTDDTALSKDPQCPEPPSKKRKRKGKISVNLHDIDNDIIYDVEGSKNKIGDLGNMENLPKSYKDSDELVLPGQKYELSDDVCNNIETDIVCDSMNKEEINDNLSNIENSSKTLPSSHLNPTKRKAEASDDLGEKTLDETTLDVNALSKNNAGHFKRKKQTVSLTECKEKVQKETHVDCSDNSILEKNRIEENSGIVPDETFSKNSKSESTDCVKLNSNSAENDSNLSSNSNVPSLKTELKGKEMLSDEIFSSCNEADSLKTFEESNSKLEDSDKCLISEKLENVVEIQGDLQIDDAQKTTKCEDGSSVQKELAWNNFCQSEDIEELDSPIKTQNKISSSALKDNSTNVNLNSTEFNVNNEDEKLKTDVETGEVQNTTSQQKLCETENEKITSHNFIDGNSSAQTNLEAVSRNSAEKCMNVDSLIQESENFSSCDSLGSSEFNSPVKRKVSPTADDEYSSLEDCNMAMSIPTNDEAPSNSKDNSDVNDSFQSQDRVFKDGIEIEHSMSPTIKSEVTDSLPVEDNSKLFLGTSKSSENNCYAMQKNESFSKSLNVNYPTNEDPSNSQDNLVPVLKVSEESSLKKIKSEPVILISSSGIGSSESSENDNIETEQKVAKEHMECLASDNISESSEKNSTSNSKIELQIDENVVKTEFCKAHIFSGSLEESDDHSINPSTESSISLIPSDSSEIHQSKNNRGSTIKEESNLMILESPSNIVLDCKIDLKPCNKSISDKCDVFNIMENILNRVAEVDNFDADRSFGTLQRLVLKDDIKVARNKLQLRSPGRNSNLGSLMEKAKNCLSFSDVSFESEDNSDEALTPPSRFSSYRNQLDDLEEIKTEGALSENTDLNETTNLSEYPSDISNYSDKSSCCSEDEDESRKNSASPLSTLDDTCDVLEAKDNNSQECAKFDKEDCPVNSVENILLDQMIPFVNLGERCDQKSFSENDCSESEDFVNTNEKNENACASSSISCIRQNPITCNSVLETSNDVNFKSEISSPKSLILSTEKNETNNSSATNNDLGNTTSDNPVLETSNQEDTKPELSMSESSLAEIGSENGKESAENMKLTLTDDSTMNRRSSLELQTPKKAGRMSLRARNPPVSSNRVLRKSTIETPAVKRRASRRLKKDLNMSLGFDFSGLSLNSPKPQKSRLNDSALENVAENDNEKDSVTSVCSSQPNKEDKRVTRMSTRSSSAVAELNNSEESTEGRRKTMRSFLVVAPYQNSECNSEDSVESGEKGRRVTRMSTRTCVSAAKTRDEDSDSEQNEKSRRTTRTSTRTFVSVAKPRDEDSDLEQGEESRRTTRTSTRTFVSVAKPRDEDSDSEQGEESRRTTRASTRTFVSVAKPHDEGSDSEQGEESRRTTRTSTRTFVSVAKPHDDDSDSEQGEESRRTTRTSIRTFVSVAKPHDEDSDLEQGEESRRTTRTSTRTFVSVAKPRDEDSDSEQGEESRRTTRASTRTFVSVAKPHDEGSDSEQGEESRRTTRIDRTFVLVAKPHDIQYSEQGEESRRKATHIRIMKPRDEDSDSVQGEESRRTTRTSTRTFVSVAKPRDEDSNSEQGEESRTSTRLSFAVAGPFQQECDSKSYNLRARKSIIKPAKLKLSK